MSPAAPLGAGRRVLVTRLDYLGDVVLSLPLVDALQARFPGLEVDYLARRPGADLLAGDDRFARVFALERGASASVRTVASLRSRRYDAVIDLYSNPRSAWLSWLTGAPVRVGGDRRGRRHLYTHRVRVPSEVRTVTDVFLAYGEPLGLHGDRAGKPTLAPRPEEKSAAEVVLAQAGAPAGPLRVGVHPGGKWPVKRWPAEKFAALARLIRSRLGAEVILFTGPGESEATEAVRALSGGDVRVLPALGIRMAAAVMAQLDATVACDGGAMHVSVAVGTPTVGIFGSSEAEVWFPYAHVGPYRAARIELACRPCHRHVCPLGTTACLNDLTAESVLRDLEDVLARGQNRRVRT